MNPTSMNQLLWSNLIATSSAEDLSNLIKSVISEHSVSDISEMLYMLVNTEMSHDKKVKVIDSIEAAYIDGVEYDLSPYLAVLYYKTGDKYLSQYYAGLVASIPENIFEELSKIVNKMCDESLPCSADSIEKNESIQEYIFQGEKKHYSVHSFSSEIGKNATVLKTPYGAIMFDCGAACNFDNADVITEVELLEFFQRIDISPDDLIAVVISHAHLDHYGSITTLINLGIGFDRIYIEDETKALIRKVANSLPSIADAMPVKAFFVPFQNVRITAFSNGHILGSMGYVITFDEINIVYTGDFCIHSQRTVEGLNIDKLVHNKEIVCHGVDCLITETTYGKKAAIIPYEEISRVFLHFVRLLLQHGYKIFIPSFAIGRSQEIALLLNQDYSILIDGLAAKISKIYESISGIKVFNSNTRYNDSFDENKEENFDVNDIIVASSGMLAQNSTSYKYVQHFLKSDKKIAIIKTGYISSESYGNELLNTWKGKNNRLFDISLSAHADFNEIYSLITALKPKHIVCIHGDGLKDCLNLHNDIVSKPNNAESYIKSIPQSETEKHSDLEETELEKTIENSGDENEDLLNKEITEVNTYSQVLAEVMQKPNDEILKLINAHLNAYSSTPKAYRTNAHSSTNESLYSTYNGLYSFVRCSSHYEAFYRKLFTLGPKKSKTYSFLSSLIDAVQIIEEHSMQDENIPVLPDDAQEKITPVCSSSGGSAINQSADDELTNIYMRPLGISLSDIAEVFAGAIIPGGGKESTVNSVQIVRPMNIVDNTLIFENKESSLCSENAIMNKNALLQTDDIVIRISGKCNWAIVGRLPGIAVASHNIAIVRAKPEYRELLRMLVETGSWEYCMLDSENTSISSLRDLPIYASPSVSLKYSSIGEIIREGKPIIFESSLTLQKAIDIIEYATSIGYTNERLSRSVIFKRQLTEFLSVAKESDFAVFEQVSSFGEDYQAIVAFLESRI